MLEQNYQTFKQAVPETVKLIAVSKTVSVDEIETLYQLGQRIFAENKVQDLLIKASQLAHLKEIKWHFIGHLQTNKIKQLLSVPNLTMIQSVDRKKLALALQAQLVKEQRQLDILLQVNITDEVGKYGCKKEEAVELATMITNNCCQLRLKGLMMIAKLDASDQQTAAYFCQLRALSDYLRQLSLPMCELSMGMSNDYQQAIAEGSTMLRIGRAIFK